MPKYMKNKKTGAIFNYDEQVLEDCPDLEPVDDGAKPAQMPPIAKKQYVTPEVERSVADAVREMKKIELIELAANNKLGIPKEVMMGKVEPLREAILKAVKE